MDESGKIALVATAAFVGFFHTITGPDHYLPFVAMSRAGNWSLRKSLTVTACCGVGHVSSSIVLGIGGLLLGAALSGMVAIEELRGGIAGWLLLTFGLAYMVWGVCIALRNNPHEHVHLHLDGTMQSHSHNREGGHAHVHKGSGAGAVSPWLLFLIFVFGPCEPLIPLLMYPAATSGIGSALLVAAVFSMATIGTMLFVVTLCCIGLTHTSWTPWERYAHATCGAATAACGAAICLGL